MKPRNANVLIASIRRDGGTQIRAGLDESTVADYVEQYRAQQKGGESRSMPDVEVFHDGTDHWLVDGFHRVEAALRAGQKRIAAAIKPGTQSAAILAACAANQTHGLRRSNADKRRAIETALRHPESSEWSARRIAKHTGVHHETVEAVRDELRAATTEQPRAVAGSQGGEIATLERRGKAGPTVKGESSDQVAETPLSKVSKAERGGESGDSAEPANRVRESARDTGATGDGDTIDSPVAVPGNVGAQAGDRSQSSATGSASPPNVSIDLLGLDDIDPAWLELTDDVVAALDAFDGHLRQAQGDLADLLSSPIGAQLQALRQAAHDLAARARKSSRPRSACLYCKDPDGTAGRRDKCNGCRGLGWLTEEQLGAVPRELTTQGDAAKVIDVERGGYVARPRTLKVELVDEAGNETAFEGDDAQVDW